MPELNLGKVKGKSAYESALDGGFVGTETEFEEKLGLVGRMVPETRTVNGKPLSADVALNAADVGALPAGVVSAANGGTGNDSGYIRAGLKSGETAGEYATAEGYKSAAPGFAAHAEGSGSNGQPRVITVEGETQSISGPIAEGDSSHAEGYRGYAKGDYSHTEGCDSQSLGENSHAEGYMTTSRGTSSHTEGLGTEANGYSSHAEGSRSRADGDYSHAGGLGTIAYELASLAGGKYNRESTPIASLTNMVGDAIVIGNGSSYEKSNCFRVNYGGEVHGLSSFKSSGADYAEYFEWLDGNPDGEDRVGYFVAMDGKRIRKAEPGEYILGVVSGQPCIIGNADEDWLGRWRHDEFGRFVIETGFAAEDGGVDTGWRYAANPAYDPSRPYVERRDRAEWDAVGMLGVLAVRDGGRCEVNGFCAVGEGGEAVAAAGYVPGQTWRVIERVSENVVRIVFR